MIGLVSYFFLPHVVDRYTRRQLAQAGAAAVLGCVPAGWLWAIICYGLINVGFEQAARWMVYPEGFEVDPAKVASDLGKALRLASDIHAS